MPALDGLDVVLGPTPEMLVEFGVPQSPAGPPGPSGGGYEHTQATPATVWTVNHNLGRRPNVAILNVGGGQILARVIHVSVNQARVYFDLPTTGLAACS